MGKTTKGLTATKAKDHKDETNNGIADGQYGCSCCGLHEAKELVKDLHSGCLLREFSCPRRSVEFEVFCFEGYKLGVEKSIRMAGWAGLAAVV